MAEFRFKKFCVRDDNCAMKVGTDSIILATSIKTLTTPKTILDIGAGSGLISLVCGQLYVDSDIVAIEIDNLAYIDLKNNVLSSEFSSRILSVHADFFEYSFQNTFDLIVTNPPYFIDSQLPEDNKRQLARHTGYFSLPKLSLKINQLLNTSGLFWMIFPYDNIKDVIYEFGKSGLFLQKKTCIRNSINHPLKRVVLCFAKTYSDNIIEEELIIRVNGKYSKQFRHQTSDIYLDQVFI